LEGHFSGPEKRELGALPFGTKGGPEGRKTRWSVSERQIKSSVMGVQPSKHGKVATASQRSCHVPVDLMRRGAQRLVVAYNDDEIELSAPPINARL